MYIADLHIHSRYSRATSKDCDLEHLDLWGRRKGIHILGTGDFTHPAWREEMKKKLIPAEDGLYVLKPEYRIKDETMRNQGIPRFVITGEISSIYKKNERVRKVHSLLLLPGLEEAELLSKKLETIGNIHSDGRPILGLDCRDLLEIMLQISPDGIYVPAHIWTPHFSLFGAFSGFDTIEECFGDLTPHIRALETGLSSDPPMNWRVSALDSYQLISNSDAHSPGKLGREANLLDIELSYKGLHAAVQEGKGLSGTIEFFPEEGKYHYDGHRKCHLCLTPLQAEEYKGICPVCKKKLTLGVSHRIEQLADREDGFLLQGAKPFESLVPLPEVLAASTGHSEASKRVKAQYEEMLCQLGEEFSILREIPLDDIRHCSGYLVAEGIRRLREGLVKRFPGFDGEYGTIQLFDRDEIENPQGQLSLFLEDTDEAQTGQKTTPLVEIFQKNGKDAGEDIEKRANRKSDANNDKELVISHTEVLNEEQERAVQTPARAIAVIAGPGTGKTKTLVSRILYLLQQRKIKPSEITAVTFTNRAAKEMKERLARELGGKRTVNLIKIGTFHSICYDMLLKQGRHFFIADELETMEVAKEIADEFSLKITPKKFLNELSLMKCGLKQESEELPLNAFLAYQERLSKMNVLDFDDLQNEMLKLLKEEKKQSFAYLLVDEFQDVSPIQYQLIREWNREGRGLFVIGDADQSIYGFRGSDSECFDKLTFDYPDICTIRLAANYRSTPQIVESATAVISKNPGRERRLQAKHQEGSKVRIISAGSELSEGIFAAKEINRLIGGIDMLDAQEKGENQSYKKGRAHRGFSDIAILYRTHRQARILEQCLGKEGIPYVVAGRDDFLNEKEVRGTLAFFRYLQEGEDELLKRISLKLLWDLQVNDVADSVFLTMVENYRHRLKKGKPSQVLKDWMKDLHFEEKKGMQKLLSTSVFYKNMSEMLEGLMFGGEGDIRRCGGKSYTSDAVTLMTLHGSKGLEFPAVILCGAEKGVIPLENGKQETDFEEERRLFYVGMTRAKEELIVVWSKDPSEFLDDIPDVYVLREHAESKRKRETVKQLNLFDYFQ